MLPAFLLIPLLWQIAHPVETTELPWTAGEYEAFSASGKCRLTIDPKTGYRRICPQASNAGSVRRFANLMTLDSPAGHDELALARFQQELRECWRLAEAYRREQFEKHGFYPVVEPCNPELKDVSRVMAPVVFGHHLHLVDVLARDAFCASVKAQHEPQSPDDERLIFRSVQPNEPVQAIDSELFCADDWQPTLE
jgi:hypothetical protein